VTTELLSALLATGSVVRPWDEVTDLVWLCVSVSFTFVSHGCFQEVQDQPTDDVGRSMYMQ
jgi:hypothetical protein